MLGVCATRCQTSTGRFELSMVLARSWRRMMISNSSSAAISGSLRWADVPQSPPLLGRRWQFRDEFWSLAGYAAATSPAVPELRLVVSSLRSDIGHAHGAYKPPRESTSRTLLSLAGFQVRSAQRSLSKSREDGGRSHDFKQSRVS